MKFLKIFIMILTIIIFICILSLSSTYRNVKKSFLKEKYTRNQLNYLYMVPKEKVNTDLLSVVLAYNKYFTVRCNIKVYIYKEINGIGAYENYYKVKIDGYSNYFFISANDLSDEPVEEKAYSDCYVNEKINDYVYIDGIMKKSFVDNYLMKYVNMIPSYIIAKYKGTITFTTRFIKDVSGVNTEGEDVTGIYIKSNQNIYVDIHYPESLLHEIGHFVDFKLHKNRKSFNILYVSERDKGDLDEYFVNSRNEFFAELYGMYLLKDNSIDNYPLCRDYVSLLDNNLRL